MESIEIFNSFHTAVASETEECLSSCLIGIPFGCGRMEVKSKDLEVFAADANRRRASATTYCLDVKGADGR